MAFIAAFAASLIWLVASHRAHVTVIFICWWLGGVLIANVIIRRAADALIHCHPALANDRSRIIGSWWIAFRGRAGWRHDDTRDTPEVGTYIAAMRVTILWMSGFWWLGVILSLVG